MPNPIRKILPYKSSHLSGLIIVSNPISSPPFPRLGQNVLRSLASVIPHRCLRPEQNYHLHGRPSRCARTHARTFCASRLERTAQLTRETAQERADTASSPKKITSASWTWARYQRRNRVGPSEHTAAGLPSAAFRPSRTGGPAASPPPPKRTRAYQHLQSFAVCYHRRKGFATVCLTIPEKFLTRTGAVQVI